MHVLISLLRLYVTEATVEINKVAHHINENIRQRENFQKMLSIQNSLTGEGAPKILAPGNKTKNLLLQSVAENIFNIDYSIFLSREAFYKRRATVEGMASIHLMFTL